SLPRSPLPPFPTRRSSDLETLSTNAICQLNLFEGMRQLGSKARFIVIGSSEEYGLVYPDELPVRETNPLRPLSPYAVSKVTQDRSEEHTSELQSLRHLVCR